LTPLHAQGLGDSPEELLRRAPATGAIDWRAIKADGHPGSGIRMVGEAVQVTEELARIRALGVAAAGVLVQCTGLGDGIPRRVRYEAVNSAGHEKTLLSLHHGPIA